jgi:hypothetical protein
VGGPPLPAARYRRCAPRDGQESPAARQEGANSPRGRAALPFNARRELRGSGRRGRPGPKGVSGDGTSTHARDERSWQRSGRGSRSQAGRRGAGDQAGHRGGARASRQARHRGPRPARARGLRAHDLRAQHVQRRPHRRGRRARRVRACALLWRAGAGARGHVGVPQRQHLRRDGVHLLRRLLALVGSRSGPTSSSTPTASRRRGQPATRSGCS